MSRSVWWSWMSEGGRFIGWAFFSLGWDWIGLGQFILERFYWSSIGDTCW